MITTAEFLKYFQLSAIATVAFAVITVAALLLKWSFRFRLVGATGFMGVLTGGLFALSLVPIVHTVIPGAIHYSVIFDNNSDRVTIAVKTPITETVLDATLRQAAADLYSYGRADKPLNIRARTTLHPSLGVTQPLVLGSATRALRGASDQAFDVKIDRANLAKIANSDNSTR